MPFKTVADLDCETTVTLGGFDKKTRKDNPTSYQGFYIGAKTIESKLGPSKLHIFQNEEGGNTGIWGKRNMDSKLQAVTPGHLTRVTFVGEVDTGKGNPMKKFRVETDTTSFIEVAKFENTEEADSGDSDYNSASADDDVGLQEGDLDSDDSAPDETPPARAQPPKTAAKPPSAQAQQSVRDLIAKRKAA